MNALNFWFCFIMIGSGCGFVSVVVLIIKAIRNRPRKETIYEAAEKEWKSITEYGREK